MLKMYFVNGLKNMFDKLLNTLSSSEIVSSISTQFDVLASVIDSYLAGIDNLRMASIILMILALLLFLFLIIIIYVKTIVAFLRNDKESSTSEIADDENDDEIFDDEDQLRLNQIIEEQERELELEKELQKELEMASAERASAEKEKQKEFAKIQEAEIQKKLAEEKRQQEQKKGSEKEFSIDLDWKKGKLREMDAVVQNIEIKPDILSYHQSNRQLNELIGLIIDMIGRGVDDLKIAQTIMFRNQYMSSEEDVLQLIDAVKDFIGLCKSQELSKLENYSYLPKEEEALFHLAEGDPSLALAMIEALMDFGIDRANSLGGDAKKDILYQEISRQALVFGNLAAINDIVLATGAFELSIELAPNNISAWSRLADMYSKAQSTSKAIWAYQNVLKSADGELNAREVANASKNLSQHLYAQGNSLQAAKLYNSSKQYYDSLGINRRLDKQEIEIIEIIESHHQDEIQSTILRILGRDSGKGFDFS